MSEKLRITSIRFRNYKAFRDYSISLNPFNVLVGPNNAGKSTVLGAIRILSEGIRRARARNPELVDDAKGRRVRGYYVRLEGLPISTENVFHNYDDSTPATAEFDISRGPDALRLYEDGKPAQVVKLPAGDGYIGELSHMIDSIRRKCPPSIVTAKDGLTAVAICEAEEESVRTGKLVRV